jgi:hypothetical protein
MDVYRMIMDYLAAHAAHDDKAKPLTLPRKVFQLTRTRLAVIGVRLCVVVAITIYACVIRVQMGGKAPKFEKRDSHLYYIEPPLSKALTRAYVYSALRCCAGRGVQTVCYSLRTVGSVYPSMSYRRIDAPTVADNVAHSSATVAAAVELADGTLPRRTGRSTRRTALHCTALHCTALHCTALHWRRYVWAYNFFLLIVPYDLCADYS